MTELSKYADCVDGQRCPDCPLAELGEARQETVVVNELIDYHEDVPLDNDKVREGDARSFAGLSEIPEAHVPAIVDAAQLVIDGLCENSTRYDNV